MPPYDSTVEGLAALVAVMLLLTTTTVTLRLIARRKQSASFGPDDWLSVCSWFAFVGACSAACYCIGIGFLGHSIPADKQLAAAISAAAPKALIPALMLAVLTLGTARLSALFFFRRIFCTARTDAFSIATIIMIVIVSLWTVGFFFSTLFACGSNIALYWSPNVRTACVVYSSQYGIAVSSFALDLIVLILPLPKIFMLRTTGARKVAIASVFLLALIGLGASCARLVILVQTQSRGAAANALDGFRVNSQNQFYQLLECSMCLVAVNLPSIWYFVAGMTPEKVLRSVRSLVSIRSRASSRARSEKNSREYSTAESLDSSSHVPVPTKRERMETTPI